MKKRYAKMAPLSEVLPQSDMNDRIFGSDEFQFYTFKGVWPHIVGPMLAKESFILRKNRNTLYIQVTNSVFLHHLFTMKQDLLARIQEYPYGKQFTDLRFVAGNAEVRKDPKLSLDSVNEAKKREQAMYSQELTDSEKEWIQNWTASHVDQRLMPVFQDLMGEVLKIRKGELASGYHPCPSCGTLCKPEETMCMTCSSREGIKNESRVMALLMSHPEWNYNDVMSVYACRYSEYDSARSTLIRQLKDKIYNKYASDVDKRTLLALLLHKPLSQITIDEANKSLSKLPVKKY